MVFRFLLALVLSAFLVAAPGQAEQRPLIIFAAASLKNALDDVAAQSGRQASISYAATSALAKQIEEGAPADIFISADLDWMEALKSANLVKADTIINLLGNTLVLVAPAGGGPAAEIKPGLDLAGLLAGGKLAMADVRAVPAGRYGKAALESLGLWTSVEGSVVQSENVRAALKLVALGEAPLGIVYGSDAVAEKTVRVLGVFPAESHPKIIYPAAITAASTHPEAAAFMAFLQTPAARDTFIRHGFMPLWP